MRRLTLHHQADVGWSAELPRELDGPNTCVLVFGGAGAALAGTPARAALAELTAAFPRSCRLGCSSAGEIVGAQVLDDTLSAAVVRFDHSQLHLAQTDLAGPADSGAAGQRLASQLPREGLRAVFLLSDGLCVNGSPLVSALTDGLPAGVVITGGLAGDGTRFERTWVLVDDEPRAGHVVALGLYGERLRIGHGCDGGWADFGPERVITRAVGNVLYELDGQPALDLYKHYLGERASGLPGTALLFPLAVRRVADEGEPLVRTILNIDEEARSLTFAGDIPQGGVARLMRSSTDRLVESAGDAAGRALAVTDESSGEALVVSISCVGRRLVLGERTEEEAEAVLDSAPHGGARVAQLGFYSYGEISPTLPGQAADLHNQSMTVTVFAEA